MMRKVLQVLLPAKADNTICGSKIPLYLYILIAAVGIVRSLIHILAPDGGASSIAGMDLAVTGADEVIFAFALWGSAQLVYALIQWVVILRYRSLISLMWGAQILETLGRMLVARLKPVTFAHTPPGAFQNYIYLVLSAAMIAFSLLSAGKTAGKST